MASQAFLQHAASMNANKERRERRGSSDGNGSSGGNRRGGRGGGGARSSSTPASTAIQERESGVREQGFISKLKDSYGFIDCLARDQKMFFHFSALAQARLEDLNEGDEVEFGVGMDRKSVREVATNVAVLSPGTIVTEQRSDEEIQGEIVKPARFSRGQAMGSHNRSRHDADMTCGFIMQLDDAGNNVMQVPFSFADQQDSSVELHAGDKVSFHTSFNIRTRQTKAVVVTLVARRPVNMQKGIVVSLKDAYGFIERADVAEQIFFHFSVLPADFAPAIGDCVQFEIVQRQDKMVAQAIEQLPNGSVNFVEVSEEVHDGEVERSLSRSRDRRTDTTASGGRISYTHNDERKTISFTERSIDEQSTDSPTSLRQGDAVKFKVARDTRNDRVHAVCLVRNRQAIADSTSRETGVICTLKDGFGFIKCCEREARLFFHFSEFLDQTVTPTLGDNVEFTVLPQARSGQSKGDKVHACSMKMLAPGSVQFETRSERFYKGVVRQEPRYSSQQSTRRQRSQPRDGGQELGQIEVVDYEWPALTADVASAAAASASAAAGTETLDKQEQEKSSPPKEEQRQEKLTLTYTDRDAIDARSRPQLGDEVQLRIMTSKRNGHMTAVEVSVTKSSGTEQTSPRLKGCLSSLKESFGFIETEQCDAEVFFHFSEFLGEPTERAACARVWYNMTTRSGGKQCAVRVTPMSSEEVERVEIVEERNLTGVVLRGLHGEGTQDCSTYGGRVSRQSELAGDDAHGVSLSFGITSLADPTLVLSRGDLVSFSVAVDVDTNTHRAVGMKLVKAAPREVLRATVDSFKGQFGFIKFKTPEAESDMLFFHASTIEGGDELDPGDEVEFTLSFNPRSQKQNAINVRRVRRAQSGKRPEYMMRKKEPRDPKASRFGLARQPSGPDGTRGFMGAGRGRPLDDTASPAPAATTATAAAAEQAVGDNIDNNNNNNISTSIPTTTTATAIPVSPAGSEDIGMFADAD